MPVRACPRCSRKLDETASRPPPSCRLCLASQRLPAPRMRRACTLRLQLGRFGSESLMSGASREGLSPDDVVSRAAAYLVSGEPGRRPARQLPRGLPEPGYVQVMELEVELAEPEWTSLASEAEQRGVSLERLLEHGVLLYLADISRGRVAETIMRRAEHEP